MNEPVNLSRRDFMKTAALVGGGLVIGFSFPAGEGGAAGDTLVSGPFLRVGPDGMVTVVVNKSEMGQGVYTSLPMLVAEELECDWRSVRVEPAPVAPAYNHATFGPQQITGGSTSVRTEWERLSRAGAAARRMLVAAAAQAWKVPEAECRAENGVVLGPGGRLSYGELAARAAALPVPKVVPLKRQSEWRLLGRRVPRLDSADKVTGRALFGIDVDAPGMLTVLIARPPVFGAQVKSFDDSAARRVPGVRGVYRVPAGVAVAAEGFHAARKGREALRVEWDEGESGKLSTQRMRGEYAQLARRPGKVARREGDAAGVLAKAAKRIEADYDVPFLAHAPMEPLNCFVDLRKDRCIIRTGTQGQTGDRDAAARLTGLKKEQV
ncbi:MAG TPA: molybdopterin cofactor-binding domain-containing protein, partial [Verrucomicrobiae bacterium]|nr:molybdopterin cofactor-binding domain-containing protein [Verrucomicrobiae bacterium]